MQILRPNKILVGILLLLLCLSCQSQRVDSVEDYLQWINAPENGLSHYKIISGLKIVVKYIPPEYQLYQEIHDNPDILLQHRDSLLQIYRQNLCFLLSISYNEGGIDKSSVIMNDITSYSEFSQRILDINFGMEKYISLRTSQGIYQPSLSFFENLYGIKNQCDVVLNFSPSKKSGEFAHVSNLDVVFNDEIFGTGISHFVFSRSAIDNVIEFPFSGT